MTFVCVLTENVALGKPCTMSSTWAGPPGNRQTPRSTGLAVDGVLSGYDAWCVHTGYDDTNAFWEVDLGRMYPIYEIVSYGRNGRRYLRGFAVAVVVVVIVVLFLLLHLSLSLCVRVCVCVWGGGGEG